VVAVGVLFAHRSFHPIWLPSKQFGTPAFVTDKHGRATRRGREFTRDEQVVTAAVTDDQLGAAFELARSGFFPHRGESS
jgi:hypothetical protein